MQQKQVRCEGCKSFVRQEGAVWGRCSITVIKDSTGTGKDKSFHAVMHESHSCYQFDAKETVNADI
jgi:hypothetical protein